MGTIEVGLPLALGGGTLFTVPYTHIYSYSHTIDSFGGFVSATATLSGDIYNYVKWMSIGVGLVFKYHDDTGSLAWQGFVNSITINTKGKSISVGPFMDVANKVRVAYSTVYYNLIVPIGGDPVVTAWASDANSQRKYGIIELELSGGETYSTEAEQARDMYLAAYKEPKSSVITGSGSEETVILDCLGDVNWLDKFIYIQTTTSQQVNLSTKLSNIVDADPNGFFNSALGIISTNTFSVLDYEEGGKTGLSILKELVSYGDSSDNRYTFGIYEGQKVIYQVAPSAVEYKSRASAPNTLFTLADVAVDPARVRPGKYVIETDVIQGDIPSANLDEDPRISFIESVTYTAPNQLTWSGSRLMKLSQRLARLGISGGVT